MAKRTSKAKARKRTSRRSRRIDPKVLARAVTWYRGAEGRTLRQAAEKYPVSFETIRRAALKRARNRRRS